MPLSGILSEAETVFLYEMAKRCNNGVIVEIGSEEAMVGHMHSRLLGIPSRPKID